MARSARDDGDFAGGEADERAVGVAQEEVAVFIELFGEALAERFTGADLDPATEEKTARGGFGDDRGEVGGEQRPPRVERTEDGGGERGAIERLAGDAAEGAGGGAEFGGEIVGLVVDVHANAEDGERRTGGVGAALSQDADNLFAAEKNVVRPLDRGLRADGFVDRSSDGDRRPRRQPRPFRLRQRGAQEQREPQPALRRRGPAPAKTSTARRLVLGENGDAAGRAVATQSGREVVGGIGLGEDQDFANERARAEPCGEVVGNEAVGRGDEPEPIAGTVLDLKTRSTQRGESGADGGGAFPELRGEIARREVDARFAQRAEEAGVERGHAGEAVSGFWFRVSGSSAGPHASPADSENQKPETRNEERVTVAVPASSRWRARSG